MKILASITLSKSTTCSKLLTLKPGVGRVAGRLAVLAGMDGGSGKIVPLVLSAGGLA